MIFKLFLIYLTTFSWITCLSGYKRNLFLNDQSRSSKKFKHFSKLSEQDPELHYLITQEWNRQKQGIELIASENFVSEGVQEALSSCLTNKYSEGYPSARYYGGNQYIDAIESLCQKRALELFNLSPHDWGINVQPYSGTPANFAVYTALLKPHDRIMGLDLPSGGHLSHGYQTTKRKVSATSLFFDSIPYRVHPETGLIDYDALRSAALNCNPKLIIAGASAYSRDWDYSKMRSIADSVGAYLMADIAHISGLVASGLCNNPFPFCHIVTTTSHKTLRGPRSGLIYSQHPLSEKINAAVFPGLQGGPHNHQIAALAVALKEAKTQEFKVYCRQVISNAQTLCSTLQGFGYSIITNGTSNHLFLLNLTQFNISGNQVERLCELCEISINKNAVPGDKSALNPHGIRIGTSAITTRGMKAQDMLTIANFLHQIIQLTREIQIRFPKLSYKDYYNVLLQPSNPFQPKILALQEQVISFSKSFPFPSQPLLHS